MSTKVLVLLCLTAISAVYANIQCNSREYGYGSTVCVCNEKTPCDNLDNLQISKDKGVITSYTTSKEGARFLHREYRFVKDQPTSPHFNVSVIVRPSERYQSIIGFGGAVTDATGLNIAKLPKKLQSRLIADYFGADGIQYALARIPIAGSDFSTRPYSYDDHPKDETLSTFALQEEDFKYKIPYLRMAQEVSNNSVKIFGSPWASPAWMKTNKELNHGGFLIGAPGGKYYELFAKYIVRFLQEYKKNNVTLWGLTVANEPEFGYKADYWFNCLGFNSTLQRDYVKLDLGPQLKAAGFGDVKVMIFDDNIPTLEEFATTVLSDREAAKFVAGTAFHWYENARFNRSVIELIAKRFPDHFLLMTEGCEEWHGAKHHVQLGNWAAFNRYADDIIKDLNTYASGWVDWNMALDTIGGPNWVNNLVDAPIIVNATGAEYYKQPMFYALGHFSKFLVPKSVRVGHYGKTDHALQDSVLTTVFERPDKSLVLTILNKNNHPVMLQLHDPQRGYLSTDVMADSMETLIWY